MARHREPAGAVGPARDGHGDRATRVVVEFWCLPSHQSGDVGWPGLLCRRRSPSALPGWRPRDEFGNRRRLGLRSTRKARPIISLSTFALCDRSPGRATSECLFAHRGMRAGRPVRFPPAARSAGPIRCADRADDGDHHRYRSSHERVRRCSRGSPQEWPVVWRAISSASA